MSATSNTARSRLRHRIGRAQDDARRWIRRNPMGAAGAALLMGALTGLLLPQSHREARLIGQAGEMLAEEVGQTASELGRESDAAGPVIQQDGGDSGGGRQGRGAGDGASGGAANRR